MNNFIDKTESLLKCYIVSAKIVIISFDILDSVSACMQKMTRCSFLLYHKHCFTTVKPPHCKKWIYIQVGMSCEKGSSSPQHPVKIRTGCIMFSLSKSKAVTIFSTGLPSFALPDYNFSLFCEKKF